MSKYPIYVLNNNIIFHIVHQDNVDVIMDFSVIFYLKLHNSTFTLGDIEPHCFDKKYIHENTVQSGIKDFECILVKQLTC